jgi:hypothetical protein
MKRIPLALLESKVKFLNVDTNANVKPYSDGAWNLGNFHISQVDGGYALHRVVNESGAVTDVFGSGHVSKRILCDLISAYSMGLHHNS